MNFLRECYTRRMSSECFIKIFNDNYKNNDEKKEVYCCICLINSNNERFPFLAEYFHILMRTDPYNLIFSIDFNNVEQCNGFYNLLKKSEFDIFSTIEVGTEVSSKLALHVLKVLINSNCYKDFTDVMKLLSFSQTLVVCISSIRLFFAREFSELIERIKLLNTYNGSYNISGKGLFFREYI